MAKAEKVMQEMAKVERANRDTDLDKRYEHLQVSLFNMQKMYESVVQEKQALMNQLRQRDALLVAAIHQKYKKGKALIAQDVLEKVSGGFYAGFDITAEDEGVLITLTKAPKEADDG